MGWLRLVGDVLAGNPDLASLLTHNPYDNSWADGWPFFRIASVLGTAFLPHRASTLGLPGLVAAVLLLVHCLGRRPAGVLAGRADRRAPGAVPVLRVPRDLRHRRAVRPHDRRLARARPSAATRSSSSGRWSWRSRSSRTPSRRSAASAPSDSSPAGARRASARGRSAVLFFYATNLGLPFALALLAGDGPWPRSRRFLVAWLVVLFVIPNVVVLSAVEFDMNKYFQMMWIAVAILAAWLIRRWPRTAIVGVLAVSPSRRRSSLSGTRPTRPWR